MFRSRKDTPEELARKADALLRDDPEFPAIVIERFAKVIETQDGFYGQDVDGWDTAFVPKEVQA